MRKALCVIAVLLLLPLVPAQAQVEAPSWEIGWESDVDDGVILDLDGNRWAVSHTLEIWIANNRPFELEVEMELELPSDVPVEAEIDSPVTVGANGNVTVEITITGTTADEVRAYAAAKVMLLTVTATEASQTNSGSTQEIEADLELPRVHRLEPTVPTPPNPFDAGTWIEMTMQLKNMGNTKDAVTEAEAEVRSCPQLSVLGLESVSGTVVEPTDVGGQAPVDVILRLEASSSHPERTCEIRLIVTSEGDGASRSTTVEVDVKAADPEEVVGDVNDVGTSDASTSTDEGSPLPLPNSLVFLAVMLAFLRGPRRVESP